MDCGPDKRVDKSQHKYSLTPVVYQLANFDRKPKCSCEGESHLLSNSFAVDCAIISMPNEVSGEAPNACIVKSKAVGPEGGDEWSSKV